MYQTISTFPTVLRAACFVLFVGASTTASALDLICPTSTTLESLVDCISLQMPRDGSSGYAQPLATQLVDMQQVAHRMLSGECSFPLPASLSANMTLRLFRDNSNSRDYCVFMEVGSSITPGNVDKGWGTFITYAGATRELSHHAPHPKYNPETTGVSGDAYTEQEAIRIFKGSDSRSYLMAGARRSANHISSRCQSKEWASDVAHNVDNMFHAINETLNAFYGARDWTAIQWHGKTDGACSNDMFMTEGRLGLPAAGSKVDRLRAQIRALAPEWKVETSGMSTCPFNGVTNVQGRLLNGVPSASVCTKYSTAPTQKFMHIEQTVNIIGWDSTVTAGRWARALNLTFPVRSAIAAPGALTGAAGNAQAILSWPNVVTATSYNVKRGTSAAGPFVLVATTGNTSYIDKGLTNGVQYHYVVTALNANESAHSTVASVTPVASVIPGAPTNLRAFGEPRQITLRWSGSGAASYSIKASLSINGPYETIATGLKTLSYTHTGLTPGVMYFYIANGVSFRGTSVDSTKASAVAR